MCHSEAELDLHSPVQVWPAERSCRNHTAHLKYDIRTVGPADSFGSKIGVVLFGLNGETETLFDCSKAASVGVWRGWSAVEEATETDSTMDGVTTVDTDGEGTGPSFLRKAARLRR